MQFYILSALLLFNLFSTAVAQDSEENAIKGILSLYENYDVVLFGEQHHLKQNHDFRVALVQHPCFPEVVNDIVIESGNALYQDILDDFVLRLKDVPDDELKKVWRNTIVPTGVWDSPIYEEFIRTVRRVNEKLPVNKRLRLLAGDPPVDWSKVNSGEEFMHFLCQRNSSPVEILKNEVLAKNRKALVIYGGLHLSRTNSERPEQPKRNLAGLLDKVIPGRVFVLMPISGANAYSNNFEQSVDTSEYPLFVNVKLSNLTTMNSDLFFFFGAKSLAETVDGIIYFGSQEHVFIGPDPSIKLDKEYQKEMNRRNSIALGNVEKKN